MASIGKDPNGRKRILFVSPDGKRKTIRLGKSSQKSAEAIKIKIEYLVSSVISGHSWDAETARWVASLSEPLAQKLAAVGLVPKRETQRKTDKLGAFLDSYIDGRANLKPNTKRNYAVTKSHLIEYFGRDRILNDICPGDADDWQEMLRKKLSTTTVSREVKRAKQFFRQAVRKKLIDDNPFADLATPAQVNTSREFFVSTDVIEQVIAMCPDAEWRLLVALSRYGGLRCPSEHLGLTWGDVDWENERLTIRSPKTEHHTGGDRRILPLFPELRRYLEEVFDEAEPGTEHIITRYRDRNSNLRTQFLRIIERAGVKPWPKLFHNLRASRQTELTSRFPLHVVCEWIGNSAAIAEKHYLQVTGDHFASAVSTPTVPKSGTESGTPTVPRCEKAAQNEAQQDAAEVGKHSQETKKARENRAILPPIASACESTLGNKAPPRGVEPLFSG